MAKPLLLIKLPVNTKGTGNGKEIHKTLLEDYHCLFFLSEKVEDIEVQCFNDCKGLQDADIEKMIKELAEKTNQ